jgi:hypothetical protein
MLPADSAVRDPISGRLGSEARILVEDPCEEPKRGGAEDLVDLVFVFPDQILRDR